MKYLARFPGYLEFTGGEASTGTGSKVGPPAFEQTPEERIASTHQQLESALEQELLDRVLAVTPTYFEQLVVDLLM